MTLGVEPSDLDRLAATDFAIDSYGLTFLLQTAEISGVDPRLRAIGERTLRSYIEDVASTITPAAVEHAGQIIVNGIPYSYHIDLLDDLDVVRDLKTKGSKPRDASAYLFQLTGYVLGFRAETERVESDVVVDVMVRLKVKRPYHVPLRYGGPVSDRDIGRFARTLENTADGIARGDFEPTGLETGVCKWCNVRTICEPYAEFIKITEGEPDAADEAKWYAQGGNDAAGHAEWDL
jgi:hypothetical protein